MENLTKLKICVERLLPEETHMMERLHRRSNSEDHLQKLRAAFFTQKLWPKGSVIDVQFLSKQGTATYTPIVEIENQREPDGNRVKIDPIEYEIRSLTHDEAVKKIVRERIEPIVDLKFRFVPYGGHVRVDFVAHHGSNSLVGTDCLRQTHGGATMNFGWLDAGTIMHEFGHALGMVHEHQNPRGKTIQWNDKNVYTWAQQTQGWNHELAYNNIIKKYSVNQTNGSSYDPKSIMLYFFPAKLTIDDKSTQENRRLSPDDVIYMNKMYPGSKESPEEFYQRVYGESLSGAEDDSEEKKSNIGKILIIVLLSLLVLGLFTSIIYILVRNGKDGRMGGMGGMGRRRQGRYR